jgi:hypothetical protein
VSCLIRPQNSFSTVFLPPRVLVPCNLWSPVLTRSVCIVLHSLSICSYLFGCIIDRVCNVLVFLLLSNRVNPDKRRTETAGVKIRTLFSTADTIARNGPDSEPVPFLPSSQSMFLRSILMLFPNLSSPFSRLTFHKWYHTKILYAFLITHILTMCLAYQNPLAFTILTILCDLHKSRSSLLCIIQNRLFTSPFLSTKVFLITLFWNMWIYVLPSNLEATKHALIFS